MSGGLEICRVCFQKTDWYETRKINVTYLREIVKTTQLTFLECPSLSSFEGHQICNTCITHFCSLKILHNLVNKSNNIVEDLMTQNCNNGNTIINLKQLFHNLNENVQICRLCLRPAAIVAIYLYETPYSIVPYNFIVKMLEECNLKLVYLKNTFKPVLCPICWQRIQVVYAFWKHCNTVSGRVDYYCKLLVKQNLDQNDLDDIIHMWDNLVHKSDSQYYTLSNCSPTPNRMYLEDHNYSKKCIADDLSDNDSDTLSATSSMDHEICRISNLDNIISPPSPPDIVNPSRSEYNFLSIIPEQISDPFSGLGFSDSEDDLPLLDRILLIDKKSDKTNKICIASNIGLNSSSKRRICHKKDIVKNPCRGRSKNIRHNIMSPPLLKNQDEVDDKKVGLKVPAKRGRKPKNYKTSVAKQRTIELLDKIRTSSQHNTEQTHDPPVEGKSTSITSNICVTQDSEDSEGPPELEWQGVCGYNPEIPTIQATFSVTDDSSVPVKKRKVGSFKCADEAETSLSSQSEETLELHIEPFLSDNESFNDSLQFKEAYVLLQKCDSDPSSKSNKNDNITQNSCVLQTLPSKSLNEKTPQRKVKRKLKLGKTVKTKYLSNNVDGEHSLSKLFKTIPEAVDDSSAVLNGNDILSKLFDDVKSTGILNNAVKVDTNKKPSLVKETEKAVDALNRQKTENQCDLCDYRGAKTVDLKRHKLLRHWTKDTKLDCSQCDRRKIGANVVCLICNRQFHPACMVAQQLFDTNSPCTHLSAFHCIVLTKHCLIVSEAVDPNDVNEPKSCECCDKPLTDYLGCEICGHYSHYKCIYDKTVGGHPICTHLPALFRKMAGILPKEDVKCDQCKTVIDNPIPCPKCLTFMHPNCFVDNYTPNCDHRDVLSSYRPSKARSKPMVKKLCDFCGKTVISLISCPKCLKHMHTACFVTDSKLMQFNCEHPDFVQNMCK